MLHAAAGELMRLVLQAETTKQREQGGDKARLAQNTQHLQVQFTDAALQALPAVREFDPDVVIAGREPALPALLECGTAHH